ncbi:MAG: hypothetical protein SVS85_04380 [Candidatus Nanohaloarchaea archaeon]|nr:hypothetical protein [Candidatus Nanohaloarchaea archaeon]
MRGKLLANLVPDAVKDLLPTAIRDMARQELYKLDTEVDNPLLIVVMDACRYDVFMDIDDPWLDDKRVEKAYTDAKWTIPRHEAIIRGSIPNNSELLSEEILENDYYKSAAPLSLQHDYAFGITGIPFLSESEYISYPFAQYFDHYHCYADHQAAEEITEEAIEQVQEHDDFFGLLNYAETHIPWSISPEEAKEINRTIVDDPESQERARDLMRKGAEIILEQVKELEPHLPSGTQVILTADHGSVFEEREGHKETAPKKRNIFHEKLFEVPLVYWTVTDSVRER